MALCSSLGGTYYRYIILLPVRIDSVMICCSKSIEISKDMVTGSPCAISITRLFSKPHSFFPLDRSGESGQEVIMGPNKKYVSFSTLSAKHTNANVSAIRHVTSDASTDAKIT